MRLGSLRHTFSDTVADIDGLAVRTRLAGGGRGGGGGGSTAGRRGVADAPTAAPTPPAAATDERLPLRGFDAVDQPASSTSGTARTWSQRLHYHAERSAGKNVSAGMCSRTTASRPRPRPRPRPGVCATKAKARGVHGLNQGQECSRPRPSCSRPRPGMFAAKAKAKRVFTAKAKASAF